jgi:hypothetical protein|tara:strand:+ start:2917 stop:6441 length:3525 start_codon:yes stop_codon:yes gene_type:complete
MEIIDSVPQLITEPPGYYTNFIYLFNDPNQVVLSLITKDLIEQSGIDQKAGLYFDAKNSVRPEASLQQFLRKNAINVAVKTFNDNVGAVGVASIRLGDFPEGSSAPSDYLGNIRKENRDVSVEAELEGNGYYKKGAYMFTNMASSNKQRAFFRTSNDIALSPFNRHNFQIGQSFTPQGGAGEVQQAIAYKYDKITSYPGDLFDASAFHAPFLDRIGAAEFGESGIQDAQQRSKTVVLIAGKYVAVTFKPQGLLGLNTNAYKEYVLKSNGGGPGSPGYKTGFNPQDYELKPLGNFTSPARFTFTQDFWIQVRTSEDSAPNGFFHTQAVQRYFDNLIFESGPVSNINNPRRLILDSATKMGVPSGQGAFDTTLSQAGVKDMEPRYEGFYNYYDSQYEPSVTFDGFNILLGHGILPSIYDFLYLPNQFNQLSTILSFGTPELESEASNLFTLKNINNYLDNLSKTYREYIKGFLVNLDPAGEDKTNTLFAGYLKDFQYPDFGPAGAPANVVYNTPIAGFFDNYKNKFLHNLATREDFRQQVLSKRTSIPSFLNEIKNGIYFSEKTLDLFNQAQQLKTTFPFVMKIDIPTEDMGPIAKLLSEIDLLDSINTHAASLTMPFDVNNQLDSLNNLNDFGYSDFETIGKFYGGTVLSEPESGQFNLFDEINLKTFRMHFVKSPESEGAYSYQDDPFLFTDTIPNEGFNSENDPLAVFKSPADIYLDSFQEIGLDSPKNVFVYREDPLKNTTLFSNLLKTIQGEEFLSRIKNLFVEGRLMRTPKEIQDGRLAHQETLMYEIAKYNFVAGFDTPRYVQSIFVPISEFSNIPYIDTQVIPHANYLYKIFTHKVIVGTKYRMNKFEKGTNPNTGLEEIIERVADDLYKHNYLVQPYLQFVRVPYHNSEMVNTALNPINYSRIDDFPPLPPQIQIVPYKGVNNKLLFLFNGSVGEVSESPIPIFEGEDVMFQNIILSQKYKNLLRRVGDPGGKYEVIFKGDDILNSVQVFRISNKPTSYKDFINDPTFNFETVDTEEAAAASFIDNIIPNQHYYYFFRGIDIHGNMSNPSSVYKIVMISDINSAPYLKVELFNFEKTEKFVDSKTFQKYLFFEANSDHDVVSFPDLSTDLDGNVFGDYENQKVVVGKSGGSTVLGKKYKLRITSKQTGRKIDINVRFKEPKDTINDI